MTIRVSIAFLIVLLVLCVTIEYRLHDRTTNRESAFAQFDRDSPSLMVYVVDGEPGTDIGKLSAGWEKEAYDQRTAGIAQLRMPLWGFTAVMICCGVFLLTWKPRSAAQSTHEPRAGA
ncbi:MAG: hypothetical protein R3C19_24985 [Planctomycetaceae bacterium]